MKILLVFAGQGYHEENLFDIFRSDKNAIAMLETFSAAANIDFLQDDLQITHPDLAQSIIGAYQLTLFTRLKPLLANHQIDFAGYSLGEVSAFLASIGANPEVSMKVFNYRTRLMGSIIPEHSLKEYDLVSITGKFILPEIQEVCERYHCYLAIINSNQHLIIGGKISDLNVLLPKLTPYHLSRAKFLEIYLPSHTLFYADKKGQFQEFLMDIGSANLQFPIISPLQLCKIYRAKEERALLDQELYTALQWHSVCDLIREYGYHLIIDLGPGSAMTAILTSSNADLCDMQIFTASHYNGIQGLLNILKQVIAS